ncbi:MAG TPA: hypothetical protein VM425_07550 [Myxococcota bacterium]|nr:hypothetical protein [Myxococcota bacterium]
MILLTRNTIVFMPTGALLATRVWSTSSISLPLRTRPKSALKLLPLDIGLAATSMGVTHDSMRTLPLDRILEGRLAEIFVGLQLLLFKSGSRVGYRFYLGPCGDERNTVKMPDGSMDYNLLSRPLYLAETIWKADAE